MNLLIADDSHEIRRILSDYAAKEGYHITTASDGEEALHQFERQSIDVVLLDVMMPKLDGYEVCRQIRLTSHVPIIMITARGEDYERIMGLDIGADDYMVKPFSPGEVMARIRAIMRRIEKTPANTNSMSELMLDNLKICLEENKVWISDTFIELTKKELELLWTLAFHKGLVFTRDHLIDSLWGYDYYGDTRTVDSHIKRLRAKLDAVPHPAWEIKTVWGKGYKLEVIDAS